MGCNVVLDARKEDEVVETATKHPQQGVVSFCPGATGLELGRLPLGHFGVEVGREQLCGDEHSLRRPAVRTREVQDIFPEATEHVLDRFGHTAVVVGLPVLQSWDDLEGFGHLA